jgi:all-trans-retinol dehydrogenase (NAD+)
MINLEKCSSVKYKEAGRQKVSTGPLTRLGLKLMMLAVLSLMFLRELFSVVFKSLRGTKKVSIEGQLCLVTGGANGLGRALANKFAQKGCNVAIIDITSTECAVKEIIEKYGVKCQGFKCDVSDSKSVEQMKSDVENALGQVDILVNNAGLLYFCPLLKASLTNIKKCISVNLTSHFMVL